MHSKTTSLESIVKVVFQAKEAAAYMGIAQSTLYKLTSAGLIGFSKPGGKKIYLSKSDCDAYMLSRPFNPVKVETDAVSHAVLNPHL